MVKNTTALCLNGELRSGDTVLSTPANDYACLVGTVLSVEKVGTPEHGTENPCDDIHVNFMDAAYSENRMQEIEQMLGDLYGRPTTPGILPPVDVDDVIMAPDMLLCITGIARDDLEKILDSAENAAVFAEKMQSLTLETPAQAALHEPDMYDDEATAALREQLINRLDANLLGYLNGIHGNEEISTPNISNEIAAYAGAHYYLTEIHNFHASELAYLMRFQDPLAVVGDKFHVAGMDDYSDVMWDIFDKQDALQGSYPLMVETPAQAALEPEKRLRTRLAENYSEYRAAMLSLSKEELFNAANEAASTRQAYTYLTEEHHFTNAEVDFLLKFQNPLDVVSDRWDAHVFDVSETVNSIFRDEKLTLRRGEYALMPEEAPPAAEKTLGAPTAAGEKPSVLEQIRKARQEAKNNPAPRKEAPAKDNGPEL